MNPHLSIQHGDFGRRPSRLAAGLLLSMLLHAALLAAWRHERRMPPDDAGIRTEIAVWLRPKPKPPPPSPKAEAAPPARSAGKPAAVGAPRSSRRPPPDLIALPPQAPATPVRPDAFTVEPAEPAAPRFDPEAARRMARQLANEPDPAKAGTALAQLPAKPLETETRAARAISRAKRRDCKDGIPGGLLAPLYLMMDKKDSGCKW